MCIQIKTNKSNVLLQENDYFYASKGFYINGGIYSLFYQQYKYIFSNDKYSIIDNKIQEVNFGINTYDKYQGIILDIARTKHTLGYHCDLFINYIADQSYYKVLELRHHSANYMQLIVKFYKKNIQYIGNKEVVVNKFQIVTDINIYKRYFKFSKNELQDFKKYLTMVAEYINIQK